MRGFSLLEVLIAMAISSILLLGASRFLPALQFGIMQQMRQQALEDDLWQQLFTVAKHLQRAGYCRGDNCIFRRKANVSLPAGTATATAAGKYRLRTKRTASVFA